MALSLGHQASLRPRVPVFKDSLRESKDGTAGSRKLRAGDKLSHLSAPCPEARRRAKTNRFFKVHRDQGHGKWQSGNQRSLGKHWEVVWRRPHNLAWKDEWRKKKETGVANAEGPTSK